MTSSPTGPLSAGSGSTTGSMGGHMTPVAGNHVMSAGNGLAPPPGSIMHQQQGHVTVSHHVTQGQGHGMHGVDPL